MASDRAAERLEAELNWLILWHRTALFLLFIGAAILAAAFCLQPKISDDWYQIWSYQSTAGPIDFISRQYMTFTGRVGLVALAAFVLPNPSIEILFRGLIVLQIFLLISLAWYCATGTLRRSRENVQAIAIFGCALWFALPVRNETVAWLTGNFAYLVPALSGLGFMAWIKRSMVPPSSGPSSKRSMQFQALVSLFAFLLGFAAGISHEQIVAAGGIYLAITLFQVARERALLNQAVNLRVLAAVAGFALGAVLLVAAPGNYVRMKMIAAPTFLTAIERMALYVPGAFFEIGTGNTGKSIWLAALVFFLLCFRPNCSVDAFRTGIRRGAMWWLMSFVSLLAMAPATNFISTRTAFFAVIFLFVGFAAAVYPSFQRECDAPGGPSMNVTSAHIENDRRFIIGTAALTILGLLVVAEAAAALLSNASVHAEFARRNEMIAQATNSASASETIFVPFIATETAALTYVQSPEHDRDFLANWGRMIGKTIKHDVSDGAPLPESYKPLKAIKFRRGS